MTTNRIAHLTADAARAHRARSACEEPVTSPPRRGRSSAPRPGEGPPCPPSHAPRERAGEKAPAPAAPPTLSHPDATDPPSNPSFPPPVHNPSLLLRFFLDGTLSVLDICDHAEVSLEQLEAWFDSDWTQSRLKTISRLAEARDNAITADALPQARQTLAHLATLTHEGTPATLHDSRRKAALAITRAAACRAPAGRAEPPHPTTAPTPRWKPQSPVPVQEAGSITRRSIARAYRPPALAIPSSRDPRPERDPRLHEMTRRKDSTKAKDWARDPAPVRVRRHTTRFRDPAATDTPPPSVAIIADLDDIPVEGPTPFHPEFARDRRGRHLVRLTCPAETSFFATGEVAGPLRRNARTTTLWNTDSFGYDIETPSLYQSHPWVLGLRHDGSAFGLLIDTTFRCEITCDAHIHVAAEGHAPAVYLIDGPFPQAVLEELSGLIGTTPLPPLWALGFHQCRYSYAAEHEVLGIAEEFRDRWLPCDTIWLDIDYMDGARTFSTDPHRFPDPEKMIAQLRNHGFRTAWILDPGIKLDPKDASYASGAKRDVFVRTPEGKPFEGDVWPGRCVFPDFTNADARRWWGDLTARFVRSGADGVWNDMNEPSVFDGPGRTIAADCLHDADAELGGPDSHARYHNVYGMQMARASFEGLLRERPDRRPFVLSRSNYLGGHRYACCWTGDSASTWEHLSWTIPMMLNLGLSGQPFAGCDIGGFADNADDVLFARWMGIGCLLPLARAHSDKNTNRHEPWSFGPACEQACRLALERRYRLLPYYYTLFRQAEATGLPPMRPLFFADPADPALRNAEDSFLLGADVLVRASASLDNSCKSPMPAGIWRLFEPAERTDESLPRLFLRAGAIIPLGPIMQHTGAVPLDPLTLVVSLDESGYAEGALYEDAGEGFGYRQGDYLLTTYAARREDNHLRVWIRHAMGERPRPLRVAEIIVLLDNDDTARATGVGGDSISVLIGPPSQNPISPAD